MKSRINVGILTFHASYNFGSVMQAYAMQKVINDLGFESTIINFRPMSQKDKYSLFPLYDGYKTILRNMLQLRFIWMKKRSNMLYEDFIKNSLNLTEECNTCADLKKLEDFDIYLAGSDQIWGYDIPEFMSSKEDIRPVYYLSYFKGYKFSYASSTGIATLNDLRKYAPLMLEFNALSTREESGSGIINELTGRNVSTVLDPTFLLSHKEWFEFALNQPCIIESKYILIYSLQGRRKAKIWKRLIDKLLLNHDIKIVTIMPFSPFEKVGTINRADAGPMEILNLFTNAEYVFTDTFHGMSFAIHMRKSFTVFEEKQADFRKRNILKLLSMESRETNNIEDCLKMYDNKFDYSKIEDVIKKNVDMSLEYIKKALCDYRNC